VVLSLALRERTVAVAFGLAAVAALVVQVLSRRGMGAGITGRHRSPSASSEVP
jgi:hypothetical protein